jgi:hypothetical protein
MTQYLLSIHQPDGPPPGPEVMDRVARDLHVLNEELKAAAVRFDHLRKAAIASRL